MPQTILDQLNLTLDDDPHLSGAKRTRLLNFLLRWDALRRDPRSAWTPSSRSNPTLVSLLDLRARAFLAQARYTDALTVMQQRLQMRTSMTARALEARIHLAQGDHYTARSIAQKLVDENPEGSTAWATLADIQLAMGDVDAAFTTYRQLNEIAPRSRAYLLGMMAIYQARADWVTASGYATRLLRIAEEEGPLPLSTLRRLREYFAASDETTHIADIDAELAHRRTEELAEMQLLFAAEEETPPRPHPLRPPPHSPQPNPHIQLPASSFQLRVSNFQFPPPNATASPPPSATSLASTRPNPGNSRPSPAPCAARMSSPSSQPAAASPCATNSPPCWTKKAPPSSSRPSSP